MRVEFAAWDEGEDTDPTAERPVTVGGKVYGSPLFVGATTPKPSRTWGSRPPKSQAELISTAKKIHKKKPSA